MNDFRIPKPQSGSVNDVNDPNRLSMVRDKVRKMVGSSFEGPESEIVELVVPLDINAAENLAIPQLSDRETKPFGTVAFVSHIPEITQDPYWFYVLQGLQFQAQKHKISVSVHSPKRAGDLTVWHQLIERAILDKVKRLIVTLPDPSRVLTLLHDALPRGIDISIIDSTATPLANAWKHQLPSVGIEDYQAGQTMALRSIQSGKLRQKVAILFSHYDAVIQEYRYRGIQKALEAFHLEVVKIVLSPSGENLGALLKQDAAISGLFCLKGVQLDILAPLLQQTDIYTCAFDKSLTAYDLMSKNKLAFTMDCSAFLQGATSLINTRHHFQIDPIVITADTIQKKLSDRKI